MTTKELARKAIDTIGNQSFSVSVYASEGGACGGGWDGDNDLSLSRAEILHLFNRPDIIDASETKAIDVESEIVDIAVESAHPEGDPFYTFNNILPEELYDLEALINETDPDDEDQMEALREEINSLGEQEYTFYADYGTADDLMYEGDEVQLTLTPEQAIGILKKEVENPDLLDEFDSEEMDEDILADMANECEILESPYSYGGESETLENYLEAWRKLLDLILDGRVTEETLPSWLLFFENREYYDSRDIEKWHEDESPIHPTHRLRPHP